MMSASVSPFLLLPLRLLNYVKGCAVVVCCVTVISACVICCDESKNIKNMRANIVMFRYK